MYAKCEKQNGNVLFIDIGTNGEIVLAQQGQTLMLLLCGRTGAGRNEYQLSGMRAAEGASRGCGDHRSME